MNKFINIMFSVCLVLPVCISTSVLILVDVYLPVSETLSWMKFIV